MIRCLPYAGFSYFWFHFPPFTATISPFFPAPLPCHLDEIGREDILPLRVLEAVGPEDVLLDGAVSGGHLARC